MQGWEERRREAPAEVLTMSQIAPFTPLVAPTLTPAQQAQAEAIRHHGRPLTALSKPELIVLLLEMNQTLGALASHVRDLMAAQDLRATGDLARQILQMRRH